MLVYWHKSVAKCLALLRSPGGICHALIVVGQRRFIGRSTSHELVQRLLPLSRWLIATNVSIIDYSTMWGTSHFSFSPGFLPSPLCSLPSPPFEWQKPSPALGISQGQGHSIADPVANCEWALSARWGSMVCTFNGNEGATFARFHTIVLQSKPLCATVERAALGNMRWLAPGSL